MLGEIIDAQQGRSGNTENFSGRCLRTKRAILGDSSEWILLRIEMIQGGGLVFHGLEVFLAFLIEFDIFNRGDDRFAEIEMRIFLE